MTLKICADHPVEGPKPTLDAMDDIEGAVVHWLGKRLYAAYEVLEHND